jgi:hypothetical protein
MKVREVKGREREREMNNEQYDILHNKTNLLISIEEECVLAIEKIIVRFSLMICV